MNLGKHELTSTWRTMRREKCLKKFGKGTEFLWMGTVGLGALEGGGAAYLHRQRKLLPPPLHPCRQNGGGLGFVGQHCCSETVAGGKPPATPAQVCGKARNIGVSIGEVSLITPSPNQPHSWEDLGEIPL